MKKDEFILFKTNNELVKHGSKIDKYVKEFKPNDYPLRKYYTEEQLENEMNPIRMGSNDFYTRCSFPKSFELHKGLNTIDCKSYWIRVFEGIEFENDVADKIKKINLLIGTSEHELKIKRNENKSYVMMDNFYIPLQQICYHDVKLFIIINEDIIMDCNIIGGSFFYTCFGKYMDNDYIEISTNDTLVDDKYKKLVVRLGMGMFGSSIKNEN